MDDRQGQITEGAGLQESRLNTDFIDWLQRWGTPILLIVCVIAIAYSGRTWWQRSQTAKFDEAHVQLNAAMIAGSPDGLLRVAREHRSTGAVAAMATLAAADAFLKTSVTGVVPGGDPTSENDRLNDDEIRANLERARDLYQEVIAAIGSDKRKVLHALQARMGVAAALIGLRDIEGANRTLTETARIAREAGFPGFADSAEARMELLRDIRFNDVLPDENDVQISARPVEGPSMSDIEALLQQRGTDVFGPAEPEPQGVIIEEFDIPTGPLDDGR
ncbi:MAG: hypothetical protein EA379_03830 [Phycisphaerales bacterium]|nr:MAG: hypothetical protein EA379_03830 [Phycisphaerales bacterium]